MLRDSFRVLIFSSLSVVRIWRISFLLGFFLAVAMPAGRGGPPAVARATVLHVDLPKAIQMALAKNFAIQVQRFDPQIAEQQVRQQLGRFDPNLEISALRSEQTTRDVFSGVEHLSRSDVIQVDRFGIGVGGLTPWGLNYDLSLGTSKDANIFSGSDALQRSDATLNFRQPLLRDFGFDSNLAQLRIARNNALVSEWQLRQRIIDTITETIAVYNDLHLAHENLRVATGFRDLARQLLADNTKRAEIGVMSPLNITTARAEAATREESVILSQRQVKNNENFLKQLITNDLEQILDVRVEIEPPRSPGFTANVPAGIADALQIRPDYRQAIIDIENRRITLAFRKDQALPRFDLQASLSLLGFDNDFGTSFDRVPRRDQTAWTIGAIFSVPIPNREGRGAVVAAQLSSAQALVNLQRLEQQIVVDVDNASGQIITARQRIESTQVARELAAESHEAAQGRLRADTGTTFEVLELQRRLAEAEFAEVRARADYNKAVSEYHRQTGTTLRVHRVEVDASS